MTSIVQKHTSITIDAVVEGNGEDAFVYATAATAVPIINTVFRPLVSANLPTIGQIGRASCRERVLMPV